MEGGGERQGQFHPHAALARGVRGGLAGVEEILYMIVGLLLLAAAVLVVIGAVSGVVGEVTQHPPDGAVDIGVTLLDRILLLLIVAELLHTLQHVVLRGEIVAEPFLFVGLIAVVRRILITTAQLEHTNLSDQPAARARDSSAG